MEDHEFWMQNKLKNNLNTDTPKIGFRIRYEINKVPDIFGKVFWSCERISKFIVFIL